MLSLKLDHFADSDRFCCRKGLAALLLGHIPQACPAYCS